MLPWAGIHFILGSGVVQEPGFRDLRHTGAKGHDHDGGGEGEGAAGAAARGWRGAGRPGTGARGDRGASPGRRPARREDDGRGVGRVRRRGVMEAAYHAAMAARERYAARTVGRRPEARGAAPEPRRRAAKVSAPAAHAAAPEPGTKTERILRRLAANIRTGPNRPSRPRPDARPARSRRPWRKPGRPRPAPGRTRPGIDGR